MIERGKEQAAKQILLTYSHTSLVPISLAVIVSKLKATGLWVAGKKARSLTHDI